MKNTIKLFAIIVFFAGFESYTIANNLKMENVSYDAEAEELTFDISWENAWHYNEQYHDAVWVFIKYKNANSNQWKHLRLLDPNISTTGLEYVPQTNLNLPPGFIFRGETQQGQFNVESASVMIKDLLLADFFNPSFKVFGLEMVYVPEGDYYLGDGKSLGRFVKNSNDTLNSQYVYNPEFLDAINEFYTLEEASKTVQTHELGREFISYFGGYSNFYCMKYEVTQEQYVDFLNTLTRVQQQNMINSDLSSSDDQRFVLSATSTPYSANGIVWANPPSSGLVTFGMDLNNNGILNEENDGGSIACNYLKIEMMLAYLDWSGLRPMSEMEYEKVCRGFDKPVPGEFSWGTPTYTSFSAQDIINAGSPAEATTISGHGLANFASNRPLRVGFASDSTTARTGSGASFFGVQNLSDNLFEVILDISNAPNFNFLAPLSDDYRDGHLGADGYSNEFWFSYSYSSRGASFRNSSGISVSRRFSSLVKTTPYSDLGFRGVIIN